MWFVVAMALAVQPNVQAKALKSENARLTREFEDLNMKLMGKEYRHGGTARAENMMAYYDDMTRKVLDPLERQIRETGELESLEQHMEMRRAEQSIKTRALQLRFLELDGKITRAQRQEGEEILGAQLRNVRATSLPKPAGELPPDLTTLRERNATLKNQIRCIRCEILGLAVATYPYRIPGR